MLTKKELGSRCHVTAKTIERWVAEGVPHTGEGRSARFDPDGVAAWRAATKRRPKGGRPKVEAPATPAPTPETVSMAEAERRKLYAEAQRLELKLAQERGQCVSLDDAKRSLEDFASAAQSRLLNLPGKLLARLFGCTDRVKFLETVEGEIREALNLLGGSE